MITEATTRAELDLHGDELIVVDFYRDDCRFCDMLAPVLDDLAYQFPFTRFLKANCSDIDGLAAEFDILAFPTVKLFREGREIDSLVGFVPAQILAERIGERLYS